MEHKEKHSDSGFTAGQLLPSSLSFTVVVKKLDGILITWIRADAHILFDLRTLAQLQSAVRGGVEQ